jgi:hypothetical protein
MTTGEALTVLDQAIFRAAPEDRPGLVVALAARLAALGAALVVPQENGQAEGVEPDRWLSLPEVARLLDVPESYVYALARQRRIPTVRLPGLAKGGQERDGKYLRVQASALRAWAAEHEDKGVDGRHNVTYSRNRDGRGGPANPKAPGAHPGSARRAARGRAEQRGAVGAPGDGHPADGRAPDAPPGPAGAAKG